MVMRLNPVTVLVYTLALLVLVSTCAAENPGERWLRYSAPEEAGWSSDQLSSICRDANASSVLLIHGGRVVYAYGQYSRRFKLHSIRKSLLSSLYGIYVRNGAISLDRTIGELRIEDHVPLTTEEKKASVGDLLKLRSGVYIPAASESQWMKETRPQRGDHAPGTNLYYNNWDANVLGTIFRQETRKDIFEEFFNRFALPLQMQDYRIMDGCYSCEEDSDHPAYPFKMSSRDLARFGQLILQNGKWHAEQIIPADWIEESLSLWSPTGDQNFASGSTTSYGYLWYTSDDYRGTRMFFAAGHYGQRLCVFPELDIVLVLQSDTYIPNTILDIDFVVDDIVFRARTLDPVQNPGFVALEEPPKTEYVTLTDKEQERYCRDYVIDDVQCSIARTGDHLFLNDYHFCYRFRLLPMSKRVFFIEDIDQYMFFELDTHEIPTSADVNKSPAVQELYSLIISRGIDDAVSEFKNYKELIGSVNELHFLSEKLAGRGIENIDVLKFNAICFPNSHYVQDKLNDALLDRWDVRAAAAVFRQVVEELHGDGIKDSKADWFHGILEAQAFPEALDDAEKAEYAGAYGQRHIDLEDDALYYRVGDSPNKLRLYKISDREFAVEGQYHRRFRFEKGNEREETRLVILYYRGTSEEATRE